MKDFNKFKADFKAGRIQVPGQKFERLLQQKVRDALREAEVYKNDKMCRITKSYTPTPLLNVLQASNALLEEDPNIIANAYKIQQMLLGIQSNGIYSSPPSEDSIKVLCLDSLSKEEIMLLYSLLLNVECSSTTDMRYHLEVLIPKTTIPRNTTTTATDTQGKKCANCNKGLLFGMLIRKKSYVSNACYYCRKPFCSNCQPRSISYSRLGLTEKQPFCKECNTILGNLDADDWMRICLQYLEQGTINSTKTALGCLTMALLSSGDKIKPVLDVAKGFLHNGLPELAMPLLASVMKERLTFKTLVQRQTLTASVLTALAEKHDARWEDRLELIQAANEACQIAERYVDKSMEVPKLAAASSDTKKALDSLLKEKPLNNDIFQTISELWSIRAYDRLLSFVMPKIFKEEDAIRNKAIEAIKYFMMMISFDAYIDKMRHDDQAALFLLNGIIKFEEGNYQEGITEIEKSAWAGNHDLEKALADVINHYMAKFPFFSITEFFDLSASSSIFKICSLASTDENRSRCLNLIFPQVNKTQFPVPAKWPNIELIGLNVKAHRKFENAVSSQVKEGNWSEWEAALAYIDYIAACNHPSQFPLCFMYASLWIYKHIQANPLLPDDVKHALTKTVVICLYQANGMATLMFAPGMKLYVSRLSLSILLHTIELTKSVAGEEAIKLATLLLHNVLYNCRFCPLWEMPLVPLSEIALLKIKVNKIHSKFLLALQHVKPEQRPIKEVELRYQLHENDICRVHPLQDPEAARSRAMEGLLAEKGWTWNDVGRLMTSPLSPRDNDGWLSRRHTLGKNLEYSKLYGFRFNTDSKNPSIELLVLPASSKDGRIGLFSREDVNTVLQMNSDEFNPAIFSLDPPSDTEHYHPFQKFRYNPSSYQDTDFLHTMFETDYLMKSFSVGTEVSAKPPFKQRPCREGLLKGLPHRLVEALKPIHERPGGYQGNVHRFWIQADKLTYTKELNQDTITIRLGEVKMTIRSHPLFPGSDGKLEDTKEEDDPDSAEAKFAADMTSAYDEISLHFPMFARLRELAKLQFLALFLKFILHSLKDKAENIEVPQEVVSSIRQDAQQSHERQVNSILTDLESKIGVWPSADDYNAISSACRKVQSSLNQYVPRSVLEKDIKTVFQQNDERLVSDLVNIFLRITKHSVSRSSMDSYVRAWLRERNSRHNRNQARSNLLSLIVSHIPLPTKQDITKVIKEHCYNDYRAFNSHLNSLKPTPKKINPDACDWVPAALYQEETENYYSLCYGGILLCPDLEPGYVYPLRKGTQAVNLHRTRISRPLGHTAPPSRPYHTSAYHAPESLAKSAVPIYIQPKAKADGASGSSAGNNNGTSGNNGASGGSSGSAGGDSSAHPGAAAGGRGGGGGDSSDESSEESNAEDYDDDEEEECINSYRFSVKRFQSTGSRGLHQMVQHVSGSNPPSFKLTDISVSFAQVLNQNRTIDSIQDDGKQTLNENHVKSKPLKFDQYFRYEVNTIKSLKSNQEFEIPCGISPHEITRKTKGVIYCIYCKSTGKMYVGRTKGPINKRMNKHKNTIRYPEKTKSKNRKLVGHFNSEGISLANDFNVVILEKYSDDKDAKHLEMKWIERLDTLEHEKGLNAIRAVAKK